jgi:hypothetical protein
MSANYGTWNDVVAHSVYPQGAPRAEKRDAGVASAHAWRIDGTVARLAERVSSRAGYGGHVDRECEQTARAILQAAGGDYAGVVAAYERLERKERGADSFFVKVAPSNAAGWQIRQVVAEWKRGVVAEQTRAVEQTERVAQSNLTRGDFTAAQFARLNPFTRAAIERAERGEE